MAEQANADDLKKCAGCKKPIKKAKRYYRNGKYYCNHNCWKSATQTTTEEAAPAA